MKIRTLIIASLFILIFFSTKTNAQYGPLYWDLRGYDSIINYRDAMNAYNQKNSTKAINVLDSVSTIYANQKNFRKQYLVENEKGAMLYLTKEDKKSFHVFEKNINQMRLNKDTLNYEFVIALRFMGYLAIGTKKSGKSKLYYLKRQIDILELMHDESPIYVDCLGDMGLSLKDTDQDLGLEYLLKSKKLAQKKGMTSSILILDNTITNRYALEQPYLSLQVQECLLATSSRKNYKDSVVLVMLAYHVATKNKEIKNYDKAISYFEYANSLMKATNNPHRKMITALPIEKLQCFSLIGDKEKFTKQVQQAIDVFYNTTEVAKISECELFSVIGNNYMPFSIDSSLFYLNKAYQVLTNNGTLSFDSLDQNQAESLAKIFNAKANSYMLIGKIEEAEQSILESIQLYTGSNDQNLPNFTCDEENDFILLETYLIASEVFSKSLNTKFNPDLYPLAIKSFYCCDTIMRRLAINISDQKSILDFAKEYKQMTANLLNIPNFLEKSPEIAFHFASNSKAFQLMADIKKNTMIPIGNDSNWINKNYLEKKLRRLTNYKKQAKKRKNTSAVDSLSIIEKDILIDLIVVNYRLMKSQNNDYNYFDNENIADLIKNNNTKNHLLVDIFQSDSNTYVFCINKNEVSCSTINNVENLNKNASQFYREIKTGKNINKSALSLSNILFKPIEEKIQNCSEITFIPDNILCQIPFEALPNPKTGKLLLKTHTISYHYSSSLWNKSMAIQTPKTHSILAIAPVFENNKNITINNTFREYHSDDEFLDRINTNDILPLPFSGIETKEIINLCKSKGISNHLLLNTEATKENFITHSNQYTILHIATHGYVSKKSPNNSGFFLYTNNNSTEKAIGFINLNEIYSLKTKADLVVLSTCNSGVGPIFEGEGLMALPRGFIYTGVSNVMASLWTVNDKKTKDLMLFFYQYLIQGETYTGALRKAKLDCIAKGYLPLNWAGFVINGR